MTKLVFSHLVKVVLHCTIVIHISNEGSFNPSRNIIPKKCLKFLECEAASVSSSQGQLEFEAALSDGCQGEVLGSAAVSNLQPVP